MKNSNDTIGDRTRDIPACSAVPQPTAPPRAPCFTQLHVDGINIATEINVKQFVSYVILTASKLLIKYAEYIEVNVEFAPGGNLQECWPPLFQFVYHCLKFWAPPHHHPVRAPPP